MCSDILRHLDQPTRKQRKGRRERERNKQYRNQYLKAKFQKILNVFFIIKW